MSDTTSVPVIYLLFGEDEYAIAQFVSGLERKMGDPGLAEMNTTRLDGRSFNLDELLSITAAMPFLAKRRLVILTNPLARLHAPSAREKFISDLEKTPPTTALVLIEYHQLTDEPARRKGEFHWLEKWADNNPDKVLKKSFTLPQGKLLEHRIQELARAAGGQITPPAAQKLAELVDDPRLADQEIQKLLAYAGYERAIEVKDVEDLTVNSREASIFGLVDALGNQDGKRALGLLYQLLEIEEPVYILTMIVRQFRLMLLAREAIDTGGKLSEIKLKGVGYWAVENASRQARLFDLLTLEGIYHRLLDLDEAIKTGQVPGDLGLNTLIVALTLKEQPLSP